MGRPPSNGGPSFRFNSAEVAEMESILQAHKCTVPERDLCQALADKFSRSAERDGKVVVQMKQIWNWFQNRRYAIRAKHSRAPGKLNVAPLQRNDLATVRSVSQAPQHFHVPPVSSGNNMLHVPQPMPAHSGQNAVKNGADNSQMEFEAKSSRDGAWYDVSSFLSHKSLENAGPAVLVRFAGFGPEEDEWINVQKNVRLRSLPCESSECVAVLPSDLILCFQEGKEQALYYDAHVLDAQRRRHDVRGCRCRFLVRYDHDQSEEIVPLRKVCRRPETDYRLQQLHADSANSDQNKSGSMPHPGNPAQVYPVNVVDLTGKKAEIPSQTTPKQSTTGVHPNSGTAVAPVSLGNAPSKNYAVPSNAPLAPASAGAVMSSASMVTNTVPVADTTSKLPMTGVNANSGTVISPVSFANTSVRTSEVPTNHSNAPASAGAVDSYASSVITTVSVDDTTKQPTAGVNANSRTVISPVSFANTSVSTSEVPVNLSNAPASAGAVDSIVSSVITMVSADDTTPKQPTTGVNANTGTVISPVSLANTSENTPEVPMNHSNVILAPPSVGSVDSSISAVTNTASVSDTTLKQPTTGINENTGTVISPVSPANTSENTSEVRMSQSNVLLAPASVGSVDSSVSTVTNAASVADTTPMYLSTGVNPNAGTVMAPVSLASPPVDISAVPNNIPNASLSSASTGAVVSSVPMVTDTVPVADTMPNQHTTGVHANSETLISPANISVNTSDVHMNHSNASAVAIDSSVSTVDKAGRDADSSSSLTSTVSPATIKVPEVTQLITSVENLAGPTTTKSEGTVNVVESVDHDVGEASSPNIGDAPGDSDENMQIG